MAGGMLVRYDKRYRRKARKQARSTKAIATKALKISKRVLRGVETKYANPSQLTQALSAASFTVHALHLIAQGDTADTRDGNKVLLKKMLLRFNFKSSAGTTLQTCAIRMVIVQDLQQVASTDIVNSDVFNNGATNWNAQFRFPTKVGRFKILLDKTYDASPRSVGYQNPGIGASASSFDVSILRQFHLKGFNGDIRYNGANNTDIQKNGIYLLVMKSNSNYTINMELDWQMKFIDS